MYSVNDGAPFGSQRPGWGMLLGDDCARQAGTSVHAAGDGRVVYARLHPPRPDLPQNWGNLVVIAHRRPATRQPFFSVYGSLAHLCVAAGDYIAAGEMVGVMAEAGSAENGGWERASLFFGIYTGPWNGNVIPGYYREDQGLTRPEWWHEPRVFIEEYNTPHEK